MMMRAARGMVVRAARGGMALSRYGALTARLVFGIHSFCYALFFGYFKFGLFRFCGFAPRNLKKIIVAPSVKIGVNRFFHF